MNLTLQLPDDLCAAARHRAGMESKTLASWFTDVLRRELEGFSKSDSPLTLVERLADTQFLERDIPLPDRRDGRTRTISFD